MVFGSNVGNWLSGGTRSRELQETRTRWAETEALWARSRFASEDTWDLAGEIVMAAVRKAGRWPAVELHVAIVGAVVDLLQAEDVIALEADWPVVDGDAVIAVEFRKMLTRRRRWVESYDRMHGAFAAPVVSAIEHLFAALPDACFGQWEEDAEGFGVPLIDLLERPKEVIEQLVLFPYEDETLRLEVFYRLRDAYAARLLVASGFSPTANILEHQDRLVMPTRHRSADTRELADLYLAGTPFREVLELPVPFHIPEEVRFEHCHVLGGTGHGKTQLMQRLIHADLVRAQQERRSVIVIDSQGDLINKLVRLSLFSPDEPGSLFDRLVLIDPADVEFPAALNLFDAHLARLQHYRPVDQERVLNGVIELYEVFFSSLLGAELTQKQGVIFKYLARLMLAIEGATIHTLMALMEDGKRFKKEMALLDGSASYFFEKEFFDSSFAATKKQILKRLWGVLSTSAFERMFAQQENKLDLFEAMNGGKIILINTAKDLLKQEGSQLFGRFFIAMIAQAALERSTLSEHERTPTMVYVDEAQEYFGDDIETILNQARKYKVGLTLAHQTLDQLSPRLRSAILSNTSFKAAGGVSARDARLLADELHTSTDFIEHMKRHKDRTEFAVWLKHHTPSAIRLTVPLGFLERQPISTEEGFEALLTRNREQYCGTLAEAQEAMRTARSANAVDVPSEEVFKSVERPVEPDSAPEPERVPDRPRPTGPARAPEPGKGGSQHRYLQQLIKGLASERGFRTAIEEAVEGGQVDVGLHREGLSIGIEISVTSTPDYEALNLAKCLRAGFDRVWAVAPDQKRRRAIEARAKERLGEAVAQVEFLTTEDMVLLLDQVGVQEPEETVVRGYKVKRSQKAVSPEEAAARRASIARVLATGTRSDV